MTATLTPKVWQVIGNYLRSVEAVTDITESIVVQTPDSTDGPWVKYTQLNLRAVGDHRSDYFQEASYQFDCYAGRERGYPEAGNLSQRVREALVNMPEADVDSVVVTGVKINGHFPLPDTQLDSRDRFIVTATIWLHP